MENIIEVDTIKAMEELKRYENLLVQFEELMKIETRKSKAIIRIKEISTAIQKIPKFDSYDLEILRKNKKTEVTNEDITVQTIENEDEDEELIV